MARNPNRAGVENKRQEQRDLIRSGATSETSGQTRPLQTEGQFKLMKLLIEAKRKREDTLLKIRTQCSCT